MRNKFLLFYCAYKHTVGYTYLLTSVMFILELWLVQNKEHSGEKPFHSVPLNMMS